MEDVITQHTVLSINITVFLGSIEMVYVTSEQCYKGIKLKQGIFIPCCSTGPTQEDPY